MTIHYPTRLYWTTIVLALISAAIHIYFGIFVYTGTIVVPMFSIAAIFLVGVVLVLANFRRSLWIKIGAGWTVLLVVLWAAAFLGNYPHTMDPLAFVVNGVEVVLIISLFALMRYGKGRDLGAIKLGFQIYPMSPVMNRTYWLSNYSHE